MFTGFYNKKIYQFSCFKAICEISVLRNYIASVSGRLGCSIQEVYLPIETKRFSFTMFLNFLCYMKTKAANKLLRARFKLKKTLVHLD